MTNQNNLKTAELVSNGLILVPDIAIEHKGKIIKPKLDMGSTPWELHGNIIKRGYVVIENGAQAMPGGVWFKTVTEARLAIDLLIYSNGDVDKFYTSIKEYEGLNEYKYV